MNAEATDGTTTLIVTAKMGRVKCTEILLEAGADVNKCRNDGVTALMMASYRCHYKCMDILLAAGADVNATDNDGGNALPLPKDYEFDDYGDYIECLNRYPRCIKRLLKAGMHINKLGKPRGMNVLGTAVASRWWIQNQLEEIPEESQFKNAALMLLYAAGETLDGTEEEDIPEVLKFEDEKLQLKHICREAIRKHLLKLDPHQHLFGRIPKLGLPSALSKYLLFNQSLDDDEDDDFHFGDVYDDDYFYGDHNDDDDELMMMISNISVEIC